MRIAVFGLGYVGTVSAACLASEGHHVIGVDPVATKVERINAGRSPIFEEGLDSLVAEQVAAGRLAATADPTEAVDKTDVAMICVGTPSRMDGSLDLTSLEHVALEIGAALATRPSRYVVVVRSTVLPGTVSGVVAPLIVSTAGRPLGTDLAVGFCPEFLREGSAIADYLCPPKVVVGATDAEAEGTIRRLVERPNAPFVATDIAVAEMVKYADNTWHALKVAFANEIGRVSQALEVDGHEVMDILCLDRKLNLSPSYLTPGNAFGGSCLPKDVRALGQRAKSLGLMTPILHNVLHSNERHLDAAIQLVTELAGRTVAILGLSFKAGTDDLREAPMVAVSERLLGKGYHLRIFDPDVRSTRLMGRNREFVDEHLPHLADLLVGSIDEAMTGADIVVIGNSDPECADVDGLLLPQQWLVDLAGGARRHRALVNYRALT